MTLHIEAVQFDSLRTIRKQRLRNNKTQTRSPTLSSDRHFMQDSTYQRFRQLIQRTGGIALGDDKKTLLTGRIRHRMRKLELHSPEEYFAAVQQDDVEVVHLLDAISTNHTFFFREADHFEVLQEFLRDRVLAGQRRFRVWCAAASSGEEPYSLAITALELFEQMHVASDFKLLATDISTKVLLQAQIGCYSQERCACLPTDLKAKYFEPEHTAAGPGFRVRDRLRDVVVFRRLNLIEFPYSQHEPIDAIFLRNVMIYFDEKTRRSIVEHMQPLLPESGLLFVGMTESLMGMHDGFEYVSPSVYRRAAVT